MNTDLETYKSAIRMSEARNRRLEDQRAELAGALDLVLAVLEKVPEPVRGKAARVARIQHRDARPMEHARETLRKIIAEP